MNRFIKEVLIVGMAVILIGTFIVTPAGAAVKEKVVVHGDTSSIPTLDPALIYLGATCNIWQNLYQALIRYKFNSFIDMEGDLAESWSISSDGLVYTFKLRDNIKWHKGFGKVTAHDVKFSFDRVMDPKTRSVFIGDLSKVKEVRVIDNLTVSIFLKELDPDFLRRCARAQPVSIVCQKAVEQYGQDFGRNPIGSGPFVFESMSREQVVLTANKEYFEGPPEIDKLVFKVIPDMDTLIMAMVRGEVDVAWSLPRDEAGLGRLKAAGCTVKGVDRGGFMTILPNHRVKPYGDIRVRRAMYHAIDTDMLIKHVLAGYGETWRSLLPKGYFGYTEEGLRRYDYDPKKAKELLAEAGYPNGFEGTVICNTTPSSLPQTTAVTGELAKVGIKLKIDAMDNAAWKTKYGSGEAALSLHLAGRRAGTNDVLMAFLTSSGFPPGPNISWYKGVDKEVTEAAHERNPTKQLKMYQEVQKKLMEDLPLIPLFMALYPAACRPHLTGLPDRTAVYGIDFFNVHFVK